MIVSLLTDYGLEGDHVGACHGVIRAVAPGAQIIDITHGVAPFDVRAGALSLRDTLAYLPIGVHVAVVDPGVGGSRRAIGVRCGDGRILLGPDNGLLSLAWEVAGGAERAIDISASPHRREPVSATFHGRDLFAPVAAALASGSRFGDAGAALDPSSLATLELPRARVAGGSLVAHVLTVDRFGNLALDATPSQLEQAEIRPGALLAVAANEVAAEALYGRTFGDVEPGALLLHEDAYGSVALAQNLGDAATALGAGPDAELKLTPRA